MPEVEGSCCGGFDSRLRISVLESVGFRNCCMERVGSLHWCGERVGSLHWCGERVVSLHWCGERLRSLYSGAVLEIYKLLSLKASVGYVGLGLEELIWN